VDEILPVILFNSGQQLQGDFHGCVHGKLPARELQKTSEVGAVDTHRHHAEFPVDAVPVDAGDAFVAPELLENA